MKTRDQRVLAALLREEHARTLAEACQCSHTIHLPALLLRHGLPQTVAFLQRKALGAEGDGSTASTYSALLQMLQIGLDEAAGGIIRVRLTDRPAATLQGLSALELPLLLAATEGAISASSWLRRMAQAQASVREAREELTAPKGGE